MKTAILALVLVAIVVAPIIAIACPPPPAPCFDGSGGTGPDPDKTHSGGVESGGNDNGSAGATSGDCTTAHRCM